jgi:hypothetical protein
MSGLVMTSRSKTVEGIPLRLHFTPAVLAGQVNFTLEARMMKVATLVAGVFFCALAGANMAGWMWSVSHDAFFCVFMGGSGIVLIVCAVV